MKYGNKAGIKIQEDYPPTERWQKKDKKTTLHLFLFGRLQQQLLSFMQSWLVTLEAISQQFNLRPLCFSACVVSQYQLVDLCTIIV